MNADVLSGFDAMGKPIPPERMSAAYKAVKEMIPDVTTERAMALVGGVADRLERDEPYEAFAFARGGNMNVDEPGWLDVTGTYRLVAHLLA